MKSGRVEDWKTGRLEDWKTGRLEDWKKDNTKCVMRNQKKASNGKLLSMTLLSTVYFLLSTVY